MDKQPDSIRLTSKEDTELRDEIYAEACRRKWTIPHTIRVGMRFYLEHVYNELGIIKARNKKKK